MPGSRITKAVALITILLCTGCAVQVMADAETDAGLKKFLLDTGKRYDALYDRVNDLLEKEYFAH